MAACSFCLRLLKQALIGSVLNQCVLERVGRLRRNSAAKDQLGAFELPHGLLKTCAVAIEQCGQQPVVKEAADAGTGLGHLLCPAESVEASHQRIL